MGLYLVSQGDLSYGWGFGVTNPTLGSGLINSMFLGLPSGVVYGIFKYGGAAVIQHYTLRFLLARRGILPFPFRDRRLVAYLDAMAGRILLRRVGGGWVFIHRTLLEYFAAQHPDHAAEAIHE